jgi:acyl-CoA dehydrogenase
VSREAEAQLAARLGAPSGRTVVAPATPQDTLALARGTLTGAAHRVPWARDADRIAAVAGEMVIVVRASDVRVVPHINLAGEPRDTVVFDGARVEGVLEGNAQALRAQGALTRVAQMAEALERVRELTIAHAREREQFGRPIARFQAVQQHLVTVAQQAAIVAVAAQAAERTRAAFEIGAAKLLANRAAITATRAAHQVHGARGTTREHPLPGFTRRLWAWRTEYGDDRYWSARLGTAAVRFGADDLYPAITGGSAVLEV